MTLRLRPQKIAGLLIWFGISQVLMGPPSIHAASAAPVSQFASCAELAATGSGRRTHIRTLVDRTDTTLASRCREVRSSGGSLLELECSHQRMRLQVAPGDARDILFQIPVGPPPEGGFPVVFIFHGSFFPVEFHRTSLLRSIGREYLPFGGLNETRLIQRLLDAGFAVVAPRAEEHLGRSLGWITNIPFFNSEYRKSGDYIMMERLLAMVADHTLGPLDPRSVFATGISSGGYHASRMAMSFPEKFRAIAVHSASYATCMGLICDIPAQLPASHPPSLLLHGALDLTVPAMTGRAYLQALERSGIESRWYEDSLAGHEWLYQAPEQITDWFSSHLPKPATVR